MSDDRNERIRRRAYELWESEERPHGEDIRHWMRAEDEFEADDQERDNSVANTETNVTPDVEITTGEHSTDESIRETEGP